MSKITKRILALIIASTLVPLYAVMNASAENNSYDVTVTLDPSVSSPFNGGRFEGWGTSLCWWANRIGYSKKLTEQSAELFFSENGLGLDIARYNLGGGDDPSHNHITRSDSKVPGYAKGFGEDGSIIYDWSEDENQRNVALAALKANPDLYFEGFSNSPPYFMTNSGCTSGADPAGSDNLNPKYRGAFARFIAETTRHFKDEFGIEFKSYSPMNEPDTEYWGVNSPKQEGCHFDAGDSESAMILETRKALDNYGLNDILVAGMDETSIDISVNNLDKLTDEAKAALGRIDTHTYGGSKRGELKEKAVNMNKDLWMSEVDGGWDGFGLAQRIILDMNGMQPSAWVMWDIVDSHRDLSFTAPDGTKSEADRTLDPKGTLWGVAMADHDAQNIELSNKYYAFGQFTKYIEPGDTIIASSNYTLAAYNKDTGSVKVVALNSSDENRSCVIDMSAFNKVGNSVKEVRSDNENEKWKEIKNEAKLDGKKIVTNLKAKSVTTYVVENNINDIGFISIDGEKIAVVGENYTYTAAASDQSDVKWSVSDESVASIDKDGVLIPKKGGNIEVIAKSASVGEASISVTVSDAPKLTVDCSMLSGSGSWNDLYDTSFYKVIDGDTSTYFDGLNGGYVTVDLGKPHIPAMIGYAPRKDYEWRMVDGIFSGSNDGTDWTELYKINKTPLAGQLTYIMGSEFDNKAYRYIRYSVPNGMNSVKTDKENCCNISELVIYASPIEFTDKQAVDNAAEIYVPTEAYGNINMPSDINGVNVVWTSSDLAVASDGKVTRGNEDKNVELRAVFTKGSESVTKDYDVTVKAAKAAEETTAYLFTHFVGTESNADSEQIYFSVSKDGTKWTTLNEGSPILKSNVGEGGVRDPHIIRSPEGDKFFMIATDLSIYNRRGDANRWGTCQTSGSKSIVIWESKDLVNWSQARLVKIAPENAGCAWAPESVYDDEKSAYMVFWASKTSDDNYTTQRIYRSYTRDFVSFTEPEIYMDGGTVSNIDTTFLKDNGIYYRFTKNESKSSVIMEKSSLLDGPFEMAESYKIDSLPGNEITGYEGPTVYKINGENKWCMLLDYYSKSGGYKPFITEDIKTGDFRSGTDFRFDTKYRHGTVMPITQSEYNALISAYSPTGADETGNLIFYTGFEKETADIGSMEIKGNIEYVQSILGRAAKLRDKSYIELKSADKASLLKGLESFTVSFMIKSDTQSWPFYAAPDNTAQTFKSEKYAGILDGVSKLTAERYNSNNQNRPTAAEGISASGEWKYAAVTYSKNSTSVYINGERVSTVPSNVNLKTLMGDNPIAYIGRANWGEGEFSSCMIDEFKVYNYSMSEQEIASEYAAIRSKKQNIEIKTETSDGKVRYEILNAPEDGKALVTLLDENGMIINTNVGNAGELDIADGVILNVYTLVDGIIIGSKLVNTKN